MASSSDKYFENKSVSDIVSEMASNYEMGSAIGRKAVVVVGVKLAESAVASLDATTVATMASQETQERLAGQVVAAMNSSTEATLAAQASQAKHDRRMAVLTTVLALCTLIYTLATGVMAWQMHESNRLERESLERAGRAVPQLNPAP